jgi:hypothetical protein
MCVLYSVKGTRMSWTTPATQTTSTHITAALWNEQITNNMTWLGVSHDHNGGAGDGLAIGNVPSGAIAVFDVACPTGWTSVSAVAAAFNGKFIVGAATYGATGGAATHTHDITSLAAHTHSIASHTHAGAGLASAYTIYQQGNGSSLDVSMTHAHATGGASAAATEAGTGAATPTAANGSNLPAYITVIFCKKD